MKDPKEALINSLMERAFNDPRLRRSLEFRQGVRSAFERRVLGERLNLIYMVGSAQADAFLAGVEEGYACWREYQDEVKDAVAKSETTT